jgi:hypothetical protein
MAQSQTQPVAALMGSLFADHIAGERLVQRSLTRLPLCPTFL